MTPTRRQWGALRGWAAMVLCGMTAFACSDTETTPAPVRFRLDTTRLCPLVPARAAAAAAFPPTPPVRVFGTDLGWTYERNGTVTMLFGDSWQRIDICPLQLNDDSLATLQVPADDWPGFTATASRPRPDVCRRRNRRFARRASRSSIHAAAAICMARISSTS